MWTPYQLVLAVLMVTTGSINTITIKWADEVESKGIDGKVKKFNHPFFQAMFMFIGEFICFIVFKILYHYYKRKEEGLEDEKQLTKGNREFNQFILVITASCDLTSTCLMFVGLIMTYASSFQMLRGSVIIFVGIFSKIFLKRVLKWIQWLSLLFIMGGLALVGLADYMSKGDGESHDQTNIVLGDLLIVVAQILVGVQMVIQEKFVAGKDIPVLQAVGWEGMFGLFIIILVQIVFYFIHADPPVTQFPGDRLENSLDALVQIANNWQLPLAILLLITSIAFFNFAGLSITKELSALTRKVLDSMRTIVIWIFSMCVFGQKFHWLQLLGYILLLTGMVMYYQIDVIKCFRKKKEGDETGDAAADARKK